MSMIERRIYIEKCIIEFLPKSLAKLISLFDYRIKGIIKTTIRTKDCLNCVTCLPDGRIATGSASSRNCVVRIWNIDTGICELKLFGHKQWVSQIAVLNNFNQSNQIVSSSYDKTLKIWNTFPINVDNNKNRLIHTLSGHSKYVYCLRVLNDGRIISGSLDGSIRIWNLEDRNLDLVYQVEVLDKMIYCINVISDDLIVYNCTDLKIMNVHTGQIVFIVESKCGVCFYGLLHNSIGLESQIIRASDDIINIYCFKTDTQNFKSHNFSLVKKTELIMKPHIGNINCYEILPDGRIITGSSVFLTNLGYNKENYIESNFKIWNINSKFIDFSFNNYGEKINRIALLPDGRIVTIGYHVIKIWE